MRISDWSSDVCSSDLQRDNRRLIDTLIRLRDLGNTVIVVEHDEDTIGVADYVVDIGPGAGEHGGEVVHAGTVKQLLKNKESITGPHLARKRSLPVPDKPRHTGNEDPLGPHARARNMTSHNAQVLHSIAAHGRPAER